MVYYIIYMRGAHADLEPVWNVLQIASGILQPHSPHARAARFRFVADEAVGPHGLPCSGGSKDAMDPVAQDFRMTKGPGSLQEDEYCDGGGLCPVDCQFNDWKARLP